MPYRATAAHTAPQPRRNPPRTVREDVVIGGEIVSQRTQLEAGRARRGRRSWVAREDMATDFEAAESTRVAAEALELAQELGCETLPTS